MWSPVIDGALLFQSNGWVPVFNAGARRAFGVMSIPTMVVVRDGKPVARSVGALPKSGIIQLAMSHLA
ncbi:hypothetical protein [Stenotrophomonas sp. RAC2]|uniref:thioredoxin family protein n=1 Tax=Stenotrophomonas sp. RAC2 TaxID=3064902 RepID=UPI0013112AC4|nr:hypothetical protein [Stenotrophomonas sp. RAC2]MDV9040589.1 hypothetical protein [Stenotrophomonas sp. RAC2]